MHTLALAPPNLVGDARFWPQSLAPRSDRIEACVIVLAILPAISATGVCAAAGVAVYGSHVRLYAEQAHARHTVAATVIDASDQTHAPHTTALRSGRFGRSTRRAQHTVQDEPRRQSR